MYIFNKQKESNFQRMSDIGCDIELNGESKYIYNLIYKYHNYFSKQDRKYRKIVHLLKIVISFFAMLSTIALGLRTVINIDTQLILGLIFSSLITFISAVSSYFNFEEYWMRNITVHIELNTIRDNFIFEAKANLLDNSRIEEYRKKLEEIQKKNIQYWERAIKKCDIRW